MADCCCSCLGGNQNGREEEMRPLVGTGGRHDDASLPRKDYESLDYDRCFNSPYADYIEKQTKDHSVAKLEAIKWVVTFFVGYLTGMVALFIDSIVKLLTRLKFSAVDDSIRSCSEDGCLILSLLMMLCFNVGFVIIASSLVVLEPIAGGSGIPEIKCYLNGVKVPRVGRLRTLVSKSVGVLFSVAGGLFVGKEGPMIHSGAIIGAGVPQFQSIAFKAINFKYSFFRTDREKRDFVSGGAAAGVAAAFGAPIGGVLFSLEEGCSFWNQKLTWRTFFCSMAATYSLNFFLSGIESDQWGYFYLPGLINFGVFKYQGQHLWNALDLLVFLAIGFLGGIFGAAFNAINKRLTIHRMNHVNKKHKVVRLLEAGLVAAVTTTIAFIGAMLVGECRPIPKSELINGTDSAVRTYFCDKGEYNDMATLFFNSQEEAIKQLFHQEGKFSLATLGIFFIVFFFLACWTYGVHVPSGLFVPSLLCGAAYGRFVATLLVNYIGYDKTIYSGTFALIGAAAFLGGVVRMTISLTVILIESTNEISYGLPLMLVLMVAKWSGDLFNEGLYDIHIKLRGVPLLEWEAPPGMERMKASDIMEKSLDFLYPITRVSSIIRILRTTAHNAFPVVSGLETKDKKAECSNSPENRTQPKNAKLRLEGVALRSQLVMLLKKKSFYRENGEAPDIHLSYEELTEEYPRYPDIFDVTRSEQIDHNMVLDVEKYMNPCPYTVFPNTPVPQVFNLFRSMGLRHLPVVSHEGQVVGMITRHNLTHEYLEMCFHDMSVPDHIPDNVPDHVADHEPDRSSSDSQS